MQDYERPGHPFDILLVDGSEISAVKAVGVGGGYKEFPLVQGAFKICLWQWQTLCVKLFDRTKEPTVNEHT